MIQTISKFIIENLPLFVWVVISLILYIILFLCVKWLIKVVKGMIKEISVMPIRKEQTLTEWLEANTQEVKGKRYVR